MRIKNVNSGSSLPVRLSAIDGDITIENTLLDNLITTNSAGIRISASGSSSVRINHMTADLPIGADFLLSDGDSGSQISIYNSILWSSAGGTPRFTGTLDAGSHVTLVNDLFFDVNLNISATIQKKINANPQWTEPAMGDYHLLSASPAVNSGTLFPLGGEPATDIEGKPRIIGSTSDRGAYESLVSDLSTVLVTNTLDSGPGSLREAMTIANNQVIAFDIRNGANVPICPAVIALNSGLPTINGRMIIDGYTQPTSTRNTSNSGFNAKLCVVVKPASGTLNNAFNVPANSFGSLVLRGLGIGGFSQPVRISGGQSSQIVGNQFGGNVGGVALPGAGLSAILIGSNASGDILVGGNVVGDSNLIGGAGQSGIDSQINATSSSFTTCGIVNNLIGMDRDGHTQLANTFGINQSGSGCYIAGNRIAGNTITNLWINNGFSNVVQQNVIGLNNLNQGYATNASGILVTGNNNVIGAVGNGGSIGANTVRYNVAGGIVVKGDSATGNSINANRIYGNGVNSDDMDIDLIPTGGASGPTPNDSGDLDSGPNGLQNFPLAKGLVYTASGSIDRPAILTAQLVSQEGVYRIDAYFSNATNSLGKRGHAEMILAHTNVQVPASGRVTFSLPIFVPNQSVGGVISLTATDPGGNTSEIGSALSTDTIFADGFE
jgi:trimeric autotransporter adhesin